MCSRVPLKRNLFYLVILSALQKPGVHILLLDKAYTVDSLSSVGWALVKQMQHASWGIPADTLTQTDAACSECAICKRGDLGPTIKIPRKIALHCGSVLWFALRICGVLSWSCIILLYDFKPDVWLQDCSSLLTYFRTARLWIFGFDFCSAVCHLLWFVFRLGRNIGSVVCRVLTALGRLGVTVVEASRASAWGNGLLDLFIDIMCFVEKESNYGGFLVRATVHVAATIHVRATVHVSWGQLLSMWGQPCVAVCWGV